MKCFAIIHNNIAIELNEIEYDKRRHLVTGIDRFGNNIGVKGDELIIVDDKELDIFKEVHNIL